MVESLIKALNMKVLINVEDDKSKFFMELIESLEYAQVIPLTEENQKYAHIRQLAEALNDAELHSKGLKKLKTAQEFINEL